MSRPERKYSETEIKEAVQTWAIKVYESPGSFGDVEDYPSVEVYAEACVDAFFSYLNKEIKAN